MALGGVCAGVTSDTSTPSRILLDIIIPYYNKYQVGIPNLNTQAGYLTVQRHSEGGAGRERGDTHSDTERGPGPSNTTYRTWYLYGIYHVRYQVYTRKGIL